MGMCWVPDCNHHSGKDLCQYFRIPKTQIIREAWIAAIGRTVSPNRDSRVCSCHFVDRNKKTVPCIFKRNGDEAYKHLWKAPRIITRKPQREFCSTTHSEDSAHESPVSTHVSQNCIISPSSVLLTESTPLIGFKDAITYRPPRWHIPVTADQHKEIYNTASQENTPLESQQDSRAYPIKIEPQNEPEIIVPDILPPNLLTTAEEKPLNKVTVAAWSRTWIK